MEEILKYLADQNKNFDPHDALSELIDQVLYVSENELSENDLWSVQAARGEGYHSPANRKKEVDRT